MRWTRWINYFLQGDGASEALNLICTPMAPKHTPERCAAATQQRQLMSSLNDMCICSDSCCTQRHAEDQARTTHQVKEHRERNTSFLKWLIPGPAWFMCSCIYRKHKSPNLLNKEYRLCLVGVLFQVYDSNCYGNWCLGVRSRQSYSMCTVELFR